MQCNVMSCNVSMYVCISIYKWNWISSHVFHLNPTQKQHHIWFRFLFLAIPCPSLVSRCFTVRWDPCADVGRHGNQMGGAWPQRAPRELWRDQPDRGWATAQGASFFRWFFFLSVFSGWLMDGWWMVDGWLMDGWFILKPSINHPSTIHQPSINQEHWWMVDVGCGFGGF